jgi:hypothetical protein
VDLRREFELSGVTDVLPCIGILDLQQQPEIARRWLRLQSRGICRDEYVYITGRDGVAPKGESAATQPQIGQRHILCVNTPFLEQLPARHARHGQRPPSFDWKSRETQRAVRQQSE